MSGKTEAVSLTNPKWYFPPFTLTAEPSQSYISLYHYTKSSSKQKIINDDYIDFMLSSSNDFIDKNEGTLILEPYYLAVGELYDEKTINRDFYHLLAGIKAEDLRKNKDNKWIFCFTPNGNSKYMKKRYAPGDGWIISLRYIALSDFRCDFNSQNHHISIVEVIYSFDKMKNILKELLKYIYQSYLSATDLEIDEKIALVKKIVINHLCYYSYSYKSNLYENEEEVRLICTVNEKFDEWISPDEKIRLKMIGKNLHMFFDNSYFYKAYQNISINDCRELNKTFLSGEEIRQIFLKEKANNI